MSKLPSLETALVALRHAPPVRTPACAAAMAEALDAIERLIRLEHDAQLRDIRRNGT